MSALGLNCQLTFVRSEDLGWFSMLVYVVKKRNLTKLCAVVFYYAVLFDEISIDFVYENSCVN